MIAWAWLPFMIGVISGIIGAFMMFLILLMADALGDQRERERNDDG